MKKDRTIGIILGLVSILFLYMTWDLPIPRNTSDVTPRTFPYMAAGGLLLCSIALFLQRGERRGDGSPFLDKAGWVRVAKLLGLLVLFPLMLHFAGFIVSALTFLFLMIRLFDLEREVPAWRTAAVSLAVTAFLYVLFSYLLKIQLPHGVALDLVRG